MELKLICCYIHCCPKTFHKTIPEKLMFSDVFRSVSFLFLVNLHLYGTFFFRGNTPPFDTREMRVGKTYIRTHTQKTTRTNQQIFWLIYDWWKHRKWKIFALFQCYFMAMRSVCVCICVCTPLGYLTALSAL